MKKRIVVIALGMVLGVLVGCGKNEDTSAEKSTTVVASENETDKTEIVSGEKKMVELMSSGEVIIYESKGSGSGYDTPAKNAHVR